MRQCLPSHPNHWTTDDEQALVGAAARYGENNWQLGKASRSLRKLKDVICAVALSMKSTFNATQCQTRYQSITETRTKVAGSWTEEEDELLRVAVGKCGTSNWAIVCKVVNGRNRHQCRDRWNKLVRSGTETGPKKDSHTEWSNEEDTKLLDAVKTLKEEYDSVSWRTVGVMLRRAEGEVRVLSPAKLGQCTHILD